jgi:hypothetical protein
MACKFEETLFYETKIFENHSDDEMITTETMLQMEMDILEALEYKIIYIGPLDILKRLTIITGFDIKIGKLNLRVELIV